MKNKILITGSSGFVGTNFIRMSPEFEIHEVDLIIQKVDEIDFSCVDSVLHLTALVHQMKGAPDEQYFKVNRDLAFEVAKKAKARGVRHFILMSTAKVFGESTAKRQPWNEYSICNPIDAYGKSKLAAEKLIQSLEDENFAIAIVRSPLIYGAGVKANMFILMKLINRFPFLPLGNIRNSRSIVFVGNLIALIKQIINKRASGIFIAGDNAPLSTTQIANQIAKSLHKKIWLIKVPGSIFKTTRLILPSIIDRLTDSLELDNHYTNEKLQFIPPFSSAEGIHEMVKWYKESSKK
jgi:nucleoside-diphosphate-sugar epimerase